MAFGELELSASHTIGEFLLPDLLSEFRRTFANVHPRLEIINSAGAITALRAGRAQIAFVEGCDSLSGLEAIVLEDDVLEVVVARDHRWARRRGLVATELTREPYLTREAASGTRAVACAALAAAGVQLTPALEVASTQSLKRSLAAGGFTIISRLSIREQVSAGVLAGLPVRDVDLSRQLQAVRRRRPALTGTARTFWRWLAARPTTG
ncbi:MAG TPA: LysR substrate-binding domain-containing protein [Solirubrobacteraceae bacterium]|nr:LysR substrate-binding domain-containing protein [Solirubrobacteraceae bacterium]